MGIVVWKEDVMGFVSADGPRVFVCSLDIKGIM